MPKVGTRRAHVVVESFGSCTFVSWCLLEKYSGGIVVFLFLGRVHGKPDPGLVVLIRGVGLAWSVWWLTAE